MIASFGPIPDVERKEVGGERQGVRLIADHDTVYRVPSLRDLGEESGGVPPRVGGPRQVHHEATRIGKEEKSNEGPRW